MNSVCKSMYVEPVNQNETVIKNWFLESKKHFYFFVILAKLIEISHLKCLCLHTGLIYFILAIIVVY